MSLWDAGSRPALSELTRVGADPGFPWFELACGASEADAVFTALGPHCPGLTMAMLEDLLTPDDSPEGEVYDDGAIRLASTFSVAARRQQEKQERGKPQGVGVLEFQPVEILAGPDWLLNCWHPTRVFQGAERIDGGPPQAAEDVFRGVRRRWERGRHGGPGDLGVGIMYELALSYVPAQREVRLWLEDWELSLYLDDELDNEDQLPELWSLTAMLRKWLTPLNRSGLRADVDKAWLPATDHEAVIEVDERVDRALEELAKMSETLRQSFGLLHVEQAEEQRQRGEKLARRFEVIGAAFLVPTLVVGFYGANTWIPGQNKHWGFWVMVVLLVALSLVAVLVVTLMQQRAEKAAARAVLEKAKLRRELLRGG